MARESQKRARKRYYLRHPAKKKEERKRYHLKHSDEFRARSRKYRDKARADLLNHYGAKCACCGEDEPKFLGIDHIDGYKKGTGPRGGGPLYSWLRMKGYPDGFQILCHNCNLAKGFYGRCPHVKV